MKSKNDKKNTATKNEVKTETAVKNAAVKTDAVKNDAVKNDAVKPQNVSTFPVFPTKLSAKTEEFCNEFKTIQLLKNRKMSVKGNVLKTLIDQEIKARIKLIEAFRTQLEFFIYDACDKVTHELD